MSSKSASDWIRVDLKRFPAVCRVSVSGPAGGDTARVDAGCNEPVSKLKEEEVYFEVDRKSSVVAVTAPGGMLVV